MIEHFVLLSVVSYLQFLAPREKAMAYSIFHIPQAPTHRLAIQVTPVDWIG